MREPRAEPRSPFFQSSVRSASGEIESEARSFEYSRNTILIYYLPLSDRNFYSITKDVNLVWRAMPPAAPQKKQKRHLLQFPLALPPCAATSALGLAISILTMYPDTLHNKQRRRIEERKLEFQCAAVLIGQMLLLLLAKVSKNGKKYRA